LKELLKIIPKIYNYKVILTLILVFIICAIPIGFLPDIFELGAIEDIKSIILQLFSLVIGFSGIIITILLLIYNFYSKSIRRNTFEIIIENRWLRTNLSLFAGLIIYFFLAYLLIDILNSITLIYSIFIITLIYIFIQFPLVVLIIKNSASTNTVRSLLNQINENVIEEFLSPTKSDGDFISYIEHYESNAIVKLKDIGLNAIREKDWGIPQNIIIGLYNKFIEPIDKSFDKEKVNGQLLCWTYVCNQFKNELFKNSDFITGKALIYKIISAYKFFTTKNIHLGRDNLLDRMIKEIFYKIIVSEEFYEFQSKILRFATEIIQIHFDAFKHPDEEIQSLHYILAQNKRKGKRQSKKKVNFNLELSEQWTYMNSDLFDIFFDAINESIELKKKRVNKYFGWKIQKLFDLIYNSENLTDYQKQASIIKLSHKARYTSQLAVENGIYIGVDFYGSEQITEWIKAKKTFGLIALHYYLELLDILNKSKQLDLYYVSELYFILSSLFRNKINSYSISAIDTIINKSIEIFNSEITNTVVKIEIQNEFESIKSFLEENDKMVETKSKFIRNINEIINIKILNA
jgi:hypothetical protein